MHETLKSNLRNSIKASQDGQNEKLFIWLKNYGGKRVHMGTIAYHYTSLPALFSIVNSKHLWMSSLRSSNDKRELFYSTDLFVKDIKGLIESESNEKTKDYLKTVLCGIENQSQYFLDHCNQESDPFGICLSERRDNLAHWDRYGNRSAGVSIGIDIEAIEDIIAKYNFEVTFGLISIGKVIYGEEESFLYSIKRRKA